MDNNIIKRTVYWTKVTLELTNYVNNVKREVEVEYKATEEYKAQEEQRRVIKAHLEAKYKFDNI